MEKKIKITLRRPASGYDIKFGALADIGSCVAAVSAPAQVLIVSNRRVFALYGEAVLQSLSAADLRAVTCLIGDGERFKNIRSLEKILDGLSEKKVGRTDLVIALGGGVVGDLAGFAASVHLRGIRFFQVPTTLLSMIDSSVGGKTGINTRNGKNLVGSFYQPAGVLIDPSVLRTLDEREITAGLCEAVKQAALAGGQTFLTLNGFLGRYALRNFRELSGDADFTKRLTGMIASQIAFKAKVVAADERENPEISDARSRKILNFGHTLAHALEKATSYRYFKHGEAVGHGVLFAAELSKKLELMDADEVRLLNDVVRRAGRLPALDDIDPLKVVDALNYDKKTVASSLQWILLKGIGKPVIVPQKDIPKSVLASSLKKFFSS